MAPSRRRPMTEALYILPWGISMRTPMRRAHWRYGPFALAAWAGLGGVASCFSGDEAPAGGRVAHPPSRAPMPVASAEAAQDGSPPSPEGMFTPLDQAIADDCQRPKDMPWRQGRPWSKNVPDRDCTNDGECGDGFCGEGIAPPSGPVANGTDSDASTAGWPLERRTC
jgi:hypothetical protein